MSDIITNSQDLAETLKTAETMPAPGRVLMVTPDHFSVDYVINPHMAGHIGTVDRNKARWQWEVVRDKFRHLGMTVHELEGQPGLPDMVFSANQSLPFIDRDGKKHALMSLMHSDQRKEEVPWFEQWYRQNGYKVHYLEGADGTGTVETGAEQTGAGGTGFEGTGAEQAGAEVTGFEGMGDAIWHFKKRLLWGGYGFRTSKESCQAIARLFDVPVVLLELVDPAFYHLDTCFCVLNANTALICPKAFTQQGLELIHAGFSNVIEAPDAEAEKLFACNAVCPDGRTVIIQKGCREVNLQLKKNGFAFHEVDTSEFLKSGGSVFCMKLLLW